MANLHLNELAARTNSALERLELAELTLIESLDELAGTLRRSALELEGIAPADTLLELEASAHELDMAAYDARAGSSMREACATCGGDVHGGDCDTRDPSDA